MQLPPKLSISLTNFFRQTQIVLSAVEETLRDQGTEFTPVAYFAALLSLLNQFIQPGKGIVNKDVATAVVYLLDLVTPSVAAPLLRSKFSEIFTKLAQISVQPDAEAPILRAATGCWETLLLAQDGHMWAQTQAEISPRKAVTGLLSIALDHRPKVRKRAQDAISKILKNPPPSPALDHPAADLCAESALMTLKAVVEASKKVKKHKDHHAHAPNSLHALQLVKTVAAASGGWPSRKIDSLCEVLLGISRSSNEYLTMAAFEVFEVMFAGMTDEVSSAKLPRVLEVILDLQPSANDTQLLPPWLAVVSRGYDVAAQVSPEDTFLQLPDVFSKISQFLNSQSHNIRVSASECLISFLVNCIPASIIIEPSIYDEKILEKLAKTVTELLHVKYQSAWMEVFAVVGAMIDNLRWRSTPYLDDAVKVIGELRANESFTGKKEADAVLEKAIHSMGPDVVLLILPLNLGIDAKERGGGRAWLLPLLREAVFNTKLAHFKSDLIPLSEKLFQRVVDHGTAEKTMEIKIFETIVDQIWSALPGYCDLPLDLSSAFDEQLAELISTLLYQRTELRTDLSRALQNLVDSNKGLLTMTGQEADLLLSRVSKDDAQKNLDYLATFAGKLLAVLFNVYTETLPSYRGPLLQCINAYLSITPTKELNETFSRVVEMLESSFADKTSTSKAEKPPKEGNHGQQMPPISHTLMDIVITMSVYLPRSSFAQLFKIAAILLSKQDANLQKKAYKLIPRLAESEAGKVALQERKDELQDMLLGQGENVTSAARRERLAAIAQIVDNLPSSDLHFVPSVLPEVVISTKEINEKARRIAFDLLVAMGEKMAGGGTIVNSKVPNMPPDSPNASASLDEYFTMVAAGLAGTTPHSVSATVTALTRILHEFHGGLTEQTTAELLDTVFTMLESASREIVRATMGFVKACVIALPDAVMQSRLQALIPLLLAYQREHKAQLQAKVKHILERMIRKYGYDAVEKATPDADRKLIVNIRKIRERSKRKKKGGAGAEERSISPEVSKKKGAFSSEYDQAVYGSDDDESGSGSDVSDDEALGRSRQRKRQGPGETYIVEDDDEPLDLLDRKALGKISSTRPLKAPSLPKGKKKARTDEDGKLVFNDDEELEDEDMLDPEQDIGDGSLEGGINAYVAAIRGRDAARRGQRGKIKFSNRRKGFEEDDLEVDEDEVVGAMKKLQTRDNPRGMNRPRGGARAGMQKARMQRRGLGMDKTRGGRVDKAPRGKMGRVR